MNKKVICCALAMSFLMSISSFSTTTAKNVDFESDLKLYADNSKDKDEKEEKDTGSGPAITANFAKFLIKKGDSIDLSKEMDLKILDDKDGDLTSEVKLPEINTSKVGKQEFELSITDTDGNNTKFPIVVNVIDFKAPLYATKFSDVSGMEYKNVLEGNTKELNIKVKELKEAEKKIVLEVSGEGYKPLEYIMDVVVDASNPIDDLGKDKKEETSSGEKTTDGQTNTGAENAGQNKSNETSNPSSKDGSKLLPQTGDVTLVTSKFATLIFAVGLAGLIIYGRKAKNKTNNQKE